MNVFTCKMKLATSIPFLASAATAKLSMLASFSKETLEILQTAFLNLVHLTFHIGTRLGVNCTKSSEGSSTPQRVVNVWRKARGERVLRDLATGQKAEVRCELEQWRSHKDKWSRWRVGPRRKFQVSSSERTSALKRYVKEALAD